MSNYKSHPPGMGLRALDIECRCQSKFGYGITGGGLCVSRGRTGEHNMSLLEFISDTYKQPTCCNEEVMQQEVEQSANVGSKCWVSHPVNICSTYNVEHLKHASTICIV